MNRTAAPRITVVTGARSGMGRATAEVLRSRGQRVLGIDLAGCDIEADLSNRAGRESAVAAVHAACPDGIDALILCAGLGGGMAPGESVVSVNYFGVVEVAEALRSLLARGTAPRVAVVSSSASILDFDEVIVAACLAGDERRARQAATAGSADELARRAGPIYAASKRALSRWIRQTSVLPHWAGTGILLNGVAPGLVRTPMTIPLLQTVEGRAILAKAVPRAVDDAAEAEDIALLLAFLASEDNRYLVGQMPFCDGGTDVIMRGDDVL